MRQILLALTSIFAVGSSPLHADRIPNASILQLNTDQSFTASNDSCDHACPTPDFGDGIDVPAETDFSASNLDYNEENLLLTNITSSPTPEPRTVILFGTGLVLAAGALRRKFARS